MARGISLHIGVGKVDSKAPCYKGPYEDLTAENDARSMEALAKEQKFEHTLLPTKKATSRNVLGEIEKAAKTLESGDMFLLTYSGHGLWSDESSRQADEWYLFDRKLTTHELHSAWGDFQAGVRIFYTLDSCYNELFGTWLRVPYHQLLARPGLKRLTDAIKASVLLISACRDTQKSYSEFTGKHGFFTEALLSVWDKGNFQGDYKQFYDAIKVRLARLLKASDSQVPQQDPAYHHFGNGPSFEGQRPFTINAREPSKPKQRQEKDQSGLPQGKPDLVCMDGKETKKSTGILVDIDNLPNCILDAYKAGIDGDPGPKDPTDYHQLLGRLVTCREKLPPLYRDAVYDPYLAKLNAMGQAKFTQILLSDPNTEGNALVVLDVAQTILQNGESYNTKATDAFQEVVSDLYDGFLSAEDRRNVKKPDKEVIPPLVKWGRPDFGPYTCPIEATSGLGLKVATVNLPPANARAGLYSWAALGHETTGHDILSADDGLLQELSTSVEEALAAKQLGHNLPEYWSSRIDETASDILGILNIGPGASLGVIGYLRGLNEAYGGKPVLRNGGDEDDYHPSDIIRGYLAAYAIRLLKFDNASAWADIIEAETKKDASSILLDGKNVDFEKAVQSAQIVASILVNGKMESLENHSLGQIQNWYNSDERIVKQLRTLLTTANQLPTKLAAGIYAAHVVAAAVISAAANGADVSLLFDRMLTILKAMHDKNPSWGPLYIVHPGNLARRLAYNVTTVDTNSID